MPSNISAAQRADLSGGNMASGLLDAGNDFEFTGIGKVMADYGQKFLQNLGKIMNERGVVASGNVLSKSKFEVMNDGTVMNLLVPDYYDYPNEGVKGVKSSSNAPNSPYQYKSFGMSAEGRASIKTYIESGKAKIRTVQKSRDKALGIGREKKQLSLVDQQVNTLVYLIKRQGIKATHYFTDAVNMTFIGTDFELKMSEAIGDDIVFVLEKTNR